MSDLALRVEHLGKRYHIGARQQANGLLGEQIVAAVKRPARYLASVLRGNGHGRGRAAETFWALRDVSFEIQHGEAIGIIGRNGAGKSTLLKVLSRITKPTTGRVELFGRVGSLLEVGTGFHGELTGRDNIFLNGAILGMRRAEITRKFDEIVAFAEMENFLDTPVKHYSSGMYMRLAFAVAAHLEPEILVVDEVLAVGDAAFQKKCLGKMSDVTKEGRTVLFVSHNFEAVQTLCTKALLLKQGELDLIDRPTACIQRLLLQMQAQSAKPSVQVHWVRESATVPRPIGIEVKAQDKLPDELIGFDDFITITLSLDAPVQADHTFAFQVLTMTGMTIFNSFYRDDLTNPPLVPGVTHSVSLTIPRHLLPGGMYEAVFAYMLPNANLFWLTRETWFEVHEVEGYRNDGLTTKRTGLVSLVLPWTNDDALREGGQATAKI